MSRKIDVEALAQMLAGLMTFERGLDRYAETRKADAPEQVSDPLAIAIDALSYYADTSNHKSRNGKPSLVAEDKGLLAREALETIDGMGKDGE